MSENYKAIQDGLSEYVKTGAIIFLLLALLFIIFIVFSVQRKRKMILEKDQLELKFQQTLLRTQLEIQEQTLKNISQEIHDNIGQALSLAKLNLNTMPATTDEVLKQKISTSKELVSKAIVDLRDLSRSLNTDYVVDMGLQRAVEYELELITKSTGIKTSLEIEGSTYRLDKQKELILFRIVQEVFNNIVKHSAAKNIFAVIRYGETFLELKITDDGKGVNLQPLNEEANNTFGLGIRNMHSRAKLIGADFRMTSSIGKGTEVKINLPITNNSNG
jgi:two-component system, NarL family, sensor kinase